MNTHADCLLQLNHLSGRAIHQLSPSFANLPHTDHMDGQYRLRRYSVVQVLDGKLKVSERHQFVQSGQINHFQGDIVRQFEPIETAIIGSEGMLEMCQMFIEANDLVDGHEIEIHQIRIAAIDEATPVAPEGIHQDGFDHIAVIGIHRHNIDGGQFKVYKQQDGEPIMALELDDGEVAMLDDHKLWHYATPIKAHQPAEPAYMDVFVLTAKD